MLTGEMIDAETAYAAGLVDEVVDDADLRARTRELAQSIAAHSPVALKLIKDAVRNALESPMAAGLRAERELFITAFASDDRSEGVAAFLEKRAPDFKGR
jgi:enoyl-CoA hydratase/carnithine racemase